MILDEIIQNKKIEIEILKKKTPLSFLEKEVTKLPKKNPVFLEALKKSSGMAVIAEIKRKSPSRGVLCEDFDPCRIARAYETGGASALSVLTDEKYFGGSSQVLVEVRAETRLPILRKDFTVDRYQVLEARLLGADAILLIAAVLTPKEMENLSREAVGLGLDVLFEVHDEKELATVLPLKPKLLGINNRDLKTFDVNVATTEKLIAGLPKNILVVSESGIQTHQDLKNLKKMGAGAVLVGESLMTQKDPGKALETLLGDFRDSR